MIKKDSSTVTTEDTQDFCDSCGDCLACCVDCVLNDQGYSWVEYERGA